MSHQLLSEQSEQINNYLQPLLHYLIILQIVTAHGVAISSHRGKIKSDEMAYSMNTSKSRHFLLVSSQVGRRLECNFSTILRPLATMTPMKAWRRETTTAVSAPRTYKEYRLFSSEWSSYRPTEIQKLSPIDREKELFKVKRRMGAAYSKGTYFELQNPPQVADYLTLF